MKKNPETIVLLDSDDAAPARLPRKKFSGASPSFVFEPRGDTPQLADDAEFAVDYFWPPPTPEIVDHCREEMHGEWREDSGKELEKERGNDLEKVEDDIWDGLLDDDPQGGNKLIDVDEYDEGIDWNEVDLEQYFDPVQPKPLQPATLQTRNQDPILVLDDEEDNDAPSAEMSPLRGYTSLKDLESASLRPGVLHLFVNQFPDACFSWMKNKPVNRQPTFQPPMTTYQAPNYQNSNYRKGSNSTNSSNPTNYQGSRGKKNASSGIQRMPTKWRGGKRRGYAKKG